MPILGIIASQNYTRVTDTGAMFPIGFVTVGSAGTASVTFSSIPATYTHLQVRAFYTNSGGTLDDAKWKFNNDTTLANYVQYHQLRGNGAAASAASSLGDYPNLSTYGASTTNFSTAIVDMLDYANTNKYKTFRSLSGHDLNGSGNILYRSALWMSTNAINEFTITANSGTFVQYSSFALYGIKGA
jgi:hypothetical protein